MVINNINGITPYAVVLLNSNASQSSYGQSQNSLFGNILSPNSNNFDSALFANLINSNRPASQQLSNSVPLLQMILPLLLKLLTGKQESGINNNEKAATSAPVNNSNVFQNQPAASASVNNKSTAQNQPAANPAELPESAANIPAANPAGLPEFAVKHPEWVSTVENSKLSDKTGVTKTIENALKKETSSEKEVIIDNPDSRYKIARFYDENGALTKETFYDKTANDSVNTIQFYEDGKLVRSLSTESHSKGKTAEWLHEGGDEYPSGYNSYDAEGKLTNSTEYDYNEKNELLHFTNSNYDENEKLSGSMEFTETKGQEITRTWLSKSYDEEGNVTHTELKQMDSERKLHTINSDEDGNVISKTTEERDSIDGTYVVVKDYDKDGKAISGGGEATAEAAPAAKKPVNEETFDL